MIKINNGFRYTPAGENVYMIATKNKTHNITEYEFKTATEVINEHKSYEFTPEVNQYFFDVSGYRTDSARIHCDRINEGNCIHGIYIPVNYEKGCVDYHHPNYVFNVEYSELSILIDRNMHCTEMYIPFMNNVKSAEDELILTEFQLGRYKLNIYTKYSSINLGTIENPTQILRYLILILEKNGHPCIYKNPEVFIRPWDALDLWLEDDNEGDYHMIAADFQNPMGIHVVNGQIKRFYKYEDWWVKKDLGIEFKFVKPTIVSIDHNIYDGSGTYKKLIDSVATVGWFGKILQFYAGEDLYWRLISMSDIDSIPVFEEVERYTLAIHDDRPDRINQPRKNIGDPPGFTYVINENQIIGQVFEEDDIDQMQWFVENGGILDIRNW